MYSGKQNAATNTPPCPNLWRGLRVTVAMITHWLLTVKMCTGVTLTMSTCTICWTHDLTC